MAGQQESKEAQTNDGAVTEQDKISSQTETCRNSNKVNTEKNESEKNAADLDATSNCKEVPKSTMTPMPESESGTKLSKNQLRKRKRQEYLAEKKIQKKLQKKEVKRQKALAEGRDLDKERKVQAENAKRGEGRKRREEVRTKHIVLVC